MTLSPATNQTFVLRHAAGETEYRVDRAHRDCGYFECVVTRAVSGTHTSVGSIQIFSADYIRELAATPEQSR